MGVIKTQCLKYAVYGFKLVLFILGFILLGIGMWAEISIHDMHELLSDNIIANAAILLMLSGAILILLSCVGVFAVRREKRKLLLWLSLAILIAFALELSAGLYAFTNRKEVRRNLANGISDAVSNTYGGQTPKSRSITAAMDWIQSNVECCGAEEPSDWEAFSTWHKKASISGRVLVPASCCKKKAEGCNQGPHVQSLLDRKSIYPDGCSKPADKFMKEHFRLVGKVGIAIAFIQLFGIVLVYALSRKLRSERSDETASPSITQLLAIFRKNNKNAGSRKKRANTELLKSPQETVNLEFKKKFGVAQSPRNNRTQAPITPPTAPQHVAVRQPFVAMPTPAQGGTFVVVPQQPAQPDVMFSPPQARMVVQYY